MAQQLLDTGNKGMRQPKGHVVVIFSFNFSLQKFMKERVENESLK